MHWRKPIRLSSSSWTRTKRVVEESAAVSVRSCLLGIFWLGLLVPATAGAETDRTIRIDIPRQRADQALIEFAEQADVTFIFPVDETRKVTANAVQGTFTQEAAIQKLLDGTGLHPKFQPNGELIVKADNSAESGGLVKKRGFIASIIAALAGGTANAQDTADTGDRRTLEEIVVTAQKREQNLQDIGISISAVGGQRIENLGLQDLNDIMRMVPGVTFSSVGPGEGNLVIRGISTRAAERYDNNVKETVGVYINETPVAQARFNPDISPFDLERVEVLRGPQGTLYGSGSLSGTVRYITNKPDTSGFAAKAGGDVSSTKHGGTNHRINAMLNVPLSETAAIRVVGYQEFKDGYIDGVGPGQFGKNQDDMDKHGGRVAVRWNPNSQFTADASVIIERFERKMSSQDNENARLGLLNGVHAGPFQQYSLVPTFLKQDTNLYNLTLNYDLGWANLTSSTSYLDRPVNYIIDHTDLFFSFYGSTTPVRNIPSNKFRDFTQELRVATTLEGPLNFIGGVFYIDQKKKQFSPSVSPGFDAAFLIPNFGVDSTFYGTPPDTPYQGRAELEDHQVAAFGELTYEMTDKWSATAGLRWFDADQDYFIETQGFVASGNPPLNRSSGESDINPKFMLSYALSDDILLSAQAARGFRLGGTNDFVPPSSGCNANLAARGLTAAPHSFQSESIWNYEIDAKTAWLENRLIVNGSVYYIDYKDIQITTSLDCGFGFTSNAATAESKGAELELVAVPLNGLQINVGAAYVDAELAEDVPALNGRKGDALPFSGEFTFNTTIGYEFPLHERLDGFIRYNYTHTDDVVFALGWKGNAATIAQPAGYDLHGISVGLTNRDRWNVSIYVDNLFDELVITSQEVSAAQRGFPEYRIRSLGQPRTVGLSVSASF